MQLGDMGGESGLDIPGGSVNAAGPATGEGGADQEDGPAAPCEVATGGGRE